MSSFAESEILWNQILNLTQQSDYIESNGLRVRLFIDLKKGEQSFFETIKTIFKSLKLLIKISSLNRINLSKNRVLFYFPFNTSAHYGNLIPVFEKQEKSDRLAISTNKIKSINSSIVLEKITGYASIYERLKSINLSTRASLNLYQLGKHFSIGQHNRSIWIKVFYYYLQIFLAQYANNRILAKLKPRAIISTSDYFPLDFALYNVANRMNIPTYLLQHGILGINFYPFTSKYFISFGEYSSKEMIEKGCAKEFIIAGGMPSSDAQFKNRRLKEIDKIKNIIILSDTQGSSIYPDIYQAYKKKLLELLVNYKDLNWFIKLHPSENIDFYKEFSLELHPNLKILPKEIDLTEALNTSDIAMTIWSTAGIDAMISNIPLVIMDVNEDVKNYAWWPTCGGGVYLNKITDIRNLNTLKMLENQNLFIHNFISNAGNSASFINKIINKHQND